MQNQVFQSVEDVRRFVRVLWTYPDAAVQDEIAVCEVLQGGRRKQTKIQRRRLLSPAFWMRRTAREA